MKNRTRSVLFQKPEVFKMRKGREFYSQNYDEVMRLHREGMSVNDISKKMNMSYSCVYHWVKGLRKPEKGNLVSFESFLRQNGPTPVAELKDKFPKHNDFFLTALRRNMQLKRCVLPRKYGFYSTWYFIEGQENLLSERVKDMLVKYREAKEKIVDLLDEMMKSIIKGE
jgi:predicted transcriptional regulator